MPARTNAVRTGKHLFSTDAYKDIVIKSLKYLVDQKRITLYGFVIMSNHLHLIWQPLFGFTPSDIQGSFMKHTSKQLKASLIINDSEALKTYKVNKYDRVYQIWKRKPLSIELRIASVFNQKLEYIPVRLARRALQSCTGRFMYLY